MGHSATVLWWACNTALTLTSFLLFGNETASSDSRVLCARWGSGWLCRDVKPIIAERMGEMERTAESRRMCVEADKVVHMIIFLGVSLMKRQEMFWQKNNDRKRFITDNYFYKSTTSVLGRQIYLHQCLGWHKSSFLGYFNKLCMWPQYQLKCSLAFSMQKCSMR